jgi:hypothetical protein
MADEKTLKQLNINYVRGFIFFHVLVFALVAGIDLKEVMANFDLGIDVKAVIGSIDLGMNKLAEDAIGVSLISALLYILTIVTSGLISPGLKARLVFLRNKNALPGCRAFSEYIDKDPRIDPKIIVNNNGILPTLPEEQNRLWYRMSKKHGDDRSVIEAHKHFLLTRDLCSIHLLFLFFLGLLSYFSMTNKTHWLIYSTSLVISLVALIVAAQNYGIRFVTNVLAAESCSKQANSLQVP